MAPLAHECPSQRRKVQIFTSNTFKYARENFLATRTNEYPRWPIKINVGGLGSGTSFIHWLHHGRESTLWEMLPHSSLMSVCLVKQEDRQTGSAAWNTEMLQCIPCILSQWWWASSHLITSGAYIIREFDVIGSSFATMTDDVSTFQRSWDSRDTLKIFHSLMSFNRKRRRRLMLGDKWRRWKPPIMGSWETDSKSSSESFSVFFSRF